MTKSFPVLAGLLATLFSLVILFACKPSVQSTAPRPFSRPLRLPAYYWPGEYWSEIAHHKGWFKEAGLEVEVIDTNPDYFASLDWIRDGKLDTQNFYLFDLLRLNARGDDLVAVLCCDRSLTEKLIARPEIRHISDLKGKKVGLSKNTYLEYLFDIAASQAALNLADVQVVDMPAEKTPDQLISGNVDAIVTWEPLASQAMTAVKGAVLFDAVQSPGVGFDVYAFKRSFVNEHPDKVQKFISVWKRATDYIKNEPRAAFAIVAQLNKKSPAEVEQYTELDQILDLQDNLRVFSFASGFDSLHGNARRLNDFMLSRGMLNTQIDTTALFDSQFLRKLRQPAP